ncbi:MAG: urease accessory protein UreD [Thermomicrobiales bacterium]
MSTAPLPARGASAAGHQEDFPREFRRYVYAGTTRVPVRPGNTGWVDLEVAACGGMSSVVRSYQQAPLQFLRPLYLDAARPGLPYVVLMQQGGGILQGDRYRLSVTCHDGAAIHVTSQSATRLYRCDESFAAQFVTISAGAGSLVEYLPDVTIPYRQSRFFQRLELHLDPEATVIVGEVLTAGRVAHGERHAYDIYYAQTHAYAPDRTLLVADTINLQPPLGSVHAPALLGPYDAFGTLSVFSRRCPAGELTGILRDALDRDARIARSAVVGVNELPNGCGVSVRMLASNGVEAEYARTVAWNAARISLIGAPAPNLRKP